MLVKRYATRLDKHLIRYVEQYLITLGHRRAAEETPGIVVIFGSVCCLQRPLARGFTELHRFLRVQENC